MRKGKRRNLKKKDSLPSGLDGLKEFLASLYTERVTLAKQPSRRREK